MTRQRLGVIAGFLAIALVTTTQPAMADPPIGPPVGGVCPAGGPGGAAGVSVGFPANPSSANLGLTLPALDVAPIDVNATITPAEGETFQPITLLQVRATPMAKVLRENIVDPEQAVMQWQFRVRQFCPDTGQLETCDYFYHEMPDGSVFEVGMLEGQLFEHAFRIECQGVAAFRAVGAPQDLGVRLLAEGKAQAPPSQIEANATDALGRHVVMAAGVPGLALPADIAAWAGVIAGAIGLASIATGPCGAAFTTIVASEIGVWTQLLTIPTSPPEIRTPKAVAAVIAKIASTVGYVALVPSCVALMVGAGATLTALLDLVMALGSIIWWMSTLGLAIYGLDFAINHWS